MLGRLVCFYIRLKNLAEENEEDGRVVWSNQHPLTTAQLESLGELDDYLVDKLHEEEDDEQEEADLDVLFHAVLKELFLWTEGRTLLDEVDCPVQRFLMVACIRKEGDGFVGVRDIPPIIAKLMYSIRAAVYTELVLKRGGQLNHLDGLGGLQVFVKELVQSPFGFLVETMHLASYLAGEASALPQVTWFGKDFMSLAIHGKRVDLGHLQEWTARSLKDCQRKLKFDVLKGMKVLKDVNWKMFDPEDDLSNGNVNYGFVTKAFDKEGESLLNLFMDNRVTEKYFKRDVVGGNVRWNKENCLKWLDKCKDFLQSLAVSCHLEGGQPARGQEFTTIRWKNGVDEMRGVLWAYGTVFLLGRYSKVRSQVGHDRLIPRFILYLLLRLTLDFFQMTWQFY